jgi:hypothetical protein
MRLKPFFTEIKQANIAPLTRGAEPRQLYSGLGSILPAPNNQKYAYKAPSAIENTGLVDCNANNWALRAFG